METYIHINDNHMSLQRERVHEKIEYIVQKGYISNTFIQTPKILNKNLANKNTSLLERYYLQLTIKYIQYMKHDLFT